MIANYEMYEEFVNEITRKVPLIKTDQLALMLSNYFKQPLETIDPVMLALYRNTAIIMTADGWSMTVGEYIKLTGDRFLQRRNSEEMEEDELERFPNMDDVCSKINKPLSKAMWLVADMLPDSKNFMLASSPWAVVFETEATEEKPTLLYQITYIGKGHEITGTEMLKVLPKIPSNKVKRVLRRICILEDESYAFRVPYVGFSHIVVIDHSRVNHFRVIDHRVGDEKWKDDPYHA